MQAFYGSGRRFDEAALLARSAGDRAFTAELIGVFADAAREQLLPGADGRLVPAVHQTLQQWRMHGRLTDEPSLSAVSSQN